jgi:hypothetical protein
MAGTPRCGVTARAAAGGTGHPAIQIPAEVCVPVLKLDPRTIGFSIEKICV